MTETTRMRNGKAKPLMTLSLLLLIIAAVLVPAWLKPGYVEGSGYLEPESWVPLFAPADGLIAEGELKDGDEVVEGRMLLTLDDEWYRWNLDSLKMELREAEAEVVLLAERILLFAEHRRIETEELSRLLEADRKLQENSSLAMNELLHSEFLLNSFVAGADREALSLSRSLRQAEGKILELGIEKALWKERLNDCILRSPISGIFYSSGTVQARNDSVFLPPLGPGSRLESGTLLGYVLPESGMKARIGIPQNKVKRCHPGQLVLLSPDARPPWTDAPIRGRLSNISGVASGGSFYADVSIDADEELIAELRSLSCGTLVARIDARGISSEKIPARIWEHWVLLVNPVGFKSRSKSRTDLRR